MLFQQRRPERVKFLGRLIHADAGTQPPEQSQMMAPCPAPRQLVLKGSPDLGIGSSNVLECGRHNANYGIDVAVQSDVRSHNGGIAREPASPERVAQHGYIRSTRFIFVCAKVSADRWRYGKNA